MAEPLSVPELPPAVPRRGRALRPLGRWALAALGWRFEGSFPDVPRCVLIAAPHTSNWDFVVGLAAMLALQLRVTWLGKHTMFRGPFAPLWRSLGGAPVDRTAAGGVVEGAAALLRGGHPVFLAVAPEGTRRKVERWKSGFWRIARAAAVPIFPVAFDHSRRRLVFGPLLTPGDDYEADLAVLQAGFHRGMARYPDRY